MILYTEDQLDDAWHYDCKIRSSLNANWVTRSMYEKLFVCYLDAIIAGDRYIKLDIYIPDYILESIGREIDLETEERLH